MLKEFKEFALKGSLLDIAVGFVMGAAFKSVVTSFTAGIVSPLIGLLFNTNLKDLKWVLKEGVANAEGKIEGTIAVLYGEFLTTVI
ncbi:MAG: MscL family protein, partial [Flavobacteriaceae bacterium]|nr:MscL family protein [Flavobacteriaceae bacterium]